MDTKDIEKSYHSIMKACPFAPLKEFFNEALTKYDHNHIFNSTYIQEIIEVWWLIYGFAPIFNDADLEDITEGYSYKIDAIASNSNVDYDIIFKAFSEFAKMAKRSAEDDSDISIETVKNIFNIYNLFNPNNHLDSEKACKDEAIKEKALCDANIAIANGNITINAVKNGYI